MNSNESVNLRAIRVRAFPPISAIRVSCFLLRESGRERTPPACGVWHRAKHIVITIFAIRMGVGILWMSPRFQFSKRDEFVKNAVNFSWNIQKMRDGIRLPCCRLTRNSSDYTQLTSGASFPSRCTRNNLSHASFRVWRWSRSSVRLRLE